jgi:hypothetical protein
MERQRGSAKDALGWEPRLENGAFRRAAEAVKTQPERSGRAAWGDECERAGRMGRANHELSKNEGA